MLENIFFFKQQPNLLGEALPYRIVYPVFSIEPHQGLKVALEKLAFPFNCPVDIDRPSLSGPH